MSNFLETFRCKSSWAAPRQHRWVFSILFFLSHSRHGDAGDVDDGDAGGGDGYDGGGEDENDTV